MLGQLSEYGLDIDLDVIHKSTLSFLSTQSRLKLMFASSGLTDRTLERFWQSVNDVAPNNKQTHGNGGNDVSHHRKSNGIASFDEKNNVDADLSISELQDISLQMNVASGMIVKIASITPTQGKQLLKLQASQTF